MEPSNVNILPSHEVLHKLAMMRQFEEDQEGLPQLIIFDNNLEVKVKAQAKSHFESWTSKEEWQNWLSWQQPGLNSLPSLLNKTITQLKIEFTDSHPGEYKLKETIKELEMAYNGLEKVRSFKTLDNSTLKIINQAMTDIHKLQENFSMKYNGKDIEPSKDLGVAYYYIPKTILEKIGKTEEINVKEAEEIVGNLQLLLKNEISVKTFIKLKSILQQDKDQNLKNMIKQSFKGDMKAFDTFDDIKPETWEVSDDDALKIKDLLNKLLFKSFVETNETGQKLKNLINYPDYQFSVGMTEQTARNFLDEEKHELLNQFLESYRFEVIHNFLQNLPNSQDLTLKIFNSAIEEFNKISDGSDLKVIPQFKKDYLRTMEFEREDSYNKIIDELPVPHDYNNLDERLKFAANAVRELCLPDNAHNQRFIPIIQMAVTQMSLGVFGEAAMSFHFQPGYLYTWSDGVHEFRWETTDHAKIKVEVIHDTLGNIEKVNVKIKGGVQISEKNVINELNIGQNKIVIKDPIIIYFNYSLKFDADGALQIEDYECKYDISLK